MEENKVKVDTRIDGSDYQKVLKIASEKYDGNKSLALRMIIKEGIAVMNPEACEHDWINTGGWNAKCAKCGEIHDTGV